MKPKRIRTPFATIASMVLAFSAVTSARAASISWNGGTGSWDDSANWTPNTLPTPADTALFGGTAGTVTATAAQSVSGLQFTSAGYTLAGEVLTLGSGGIDASMLSSGATTINNPITISPGVQRWNVGAGASLDVGNFSTSSVTNTNSQWGPNGGIAILSSTGSISTTATNGWDWRGGGPGLLGPGLVIDNGDNTYDWAFAGVGGVISAPTYMAPGTGDKNNVLVTADTTLTLNASWASIKVDAATFTANGANLYVDTGIILQNGGTIAGGAPLKSNNDGLYIYTPDSGTISKSIQNNGTNAKNLYKAGTGTLTLSGTNTYSGATFVEKGTLKVGNGTAGSIANTSGVTVRPAATLAFDMAAASTFVAPILNDGTLSATGGNSLTLSGFIDGAGNIVKSGAGTLTVSSGGLLSGGATVSGGTFRVNGFLDDCPVDLGAATLSGNGSVGAVTVGDAGAVITNGNGNTDPLSLASLAFDTTGTLNLKIEDQFGVPLEVSGELDIGPGFTINVATPPAWVGGETYDLILYGSLTGSVSNIVKGTIPGLGGRQTATLGNSGSAITLTITGDTPVWTGLQSGAWTTAAIGGSKNWELQIGGTPTDFIANDQVLFDDSAAGTTDVVIADADVQVASVVVDNDSLDYGISSSGGYGISDFGGSPATLVKSGEATVTLLTDNDYTGLTTINDGTLQLGDGTTDGDIASSSGIANSGTLIFNRSAGPFTYGNAISGFGDVIKNGAGTQILDGTNAMSGTLTINEGTLQVGDGGTTGSLGSAMIANNASLVFDRSNGAVQGADFGAIGGTGSLTQAGTGTLTLTGNTYSGGTTINPGTTIAVSGGSALGSGPVAIDGGSLTNSGDASVGNEIVVGAGGASIGIGVDQNFTLSGTLSGAGDVNIASTAFVKSLNWNFSSNTMTSGTITMAAGGNNTTVLRLNNPAATSAALDWVLNGAADRGIPIGAAGTYHFGSLAGSGILQGNFQPGTTLITLSIGGNNNSADFTGSIRNNGPTVSVVKVGTGTQALTGANTYTGDTTVLAGVLAVDGGSIVDTNKLVIDGGKVDPMGGTEVVGTLFFGATQQAAGTWGATGSGATHIDDARFTGTGVVSVTTGPAGNTYADWANANAPGQTKDQDHDNDGVENGIEYFMGLSGSAFTANPAPVSGTVTWPMGADYMGVYGTDYEVQTSTDLVTWTMVPVGTGDNTVTVTAGTSVVYDMPAGGGKLFVRLVVKN